MKKNIKVLHVIVSLANGGAERQLVEILKHNKNHGVLILSNADIYKETLENLGNNYWELGVEKKLFVFKKIFAFKNIINKFNPDIIQAWMYNACFFSSICKLMRLYNKPIFWSIRCSEMITKYYSFSLKFVIYACSKLSSKTDKIIYNSFAGMKYHQEIGFSKNNDEVVFNGVDSNKFKANSVERKKLRKRYNLNTKDLVLLCVARVDPMKNYENFLKAFEFVKKSNSINSKLVLIGKDTDKLKLPIDCIALGMKKDIEIYYNLADIIISPSAFGEGFSNVLIEGMLTNLLPVATDVGDSKKIIGNTGYIIESSNIETIQNKLLKIINLKNLHIKNLANKSRNRASKMFSVNKMIQSYNNIYTEVID
jgi:glycosyltransferase involved in cell wall biosynthesis